MSTTELHTFVQKFHQLWNAGLNAHLDIDCHAGVAWVGLRLQLGPPPGPSHHQVYPSPHHRKSFSPSYQRRRERRSATHTNREHAEEASKQTNNNSNEHAEEAAPETMNVTASVIDRNENDEVHEYENVEVDVVEENNEAEQNDENTNECENAEVKTVEGVQENNDERNVETVNSNIPDEAPCVATSEMTVSQEKPVPVPDIIPVFCIANLEDCPDSQLNDEYCQSIRRFIGSEQHLVNNISSSELQYVESRSQSNNLYTHTVSIVMYVRTARLWENPANYVRKHLGLMNYWKRSNGTIVRLSRIHQKEKPG